MTTRATVPFHIWKHEVLVLLAGAGVSGAAIAHVSKLANGGSRLVLMANAGESIQMAADTLISMAKGYDKAVADDYVDDIEAIRRAVRFDREGWRR